MGRRLVESVEVRRRDGVPEQFLWRSRLYAVRDVLEHWFESGRWWSSERAMALAAGGDSSGVPGTAGVSGLAGASGPPCPAFLDDREQEFWRVEAGPGRSASLGVYDLCFDWSKGSWQLMEVHD
jgi:hypothetical protein